MRSFVGCVVAVLALISFGFVSTPNAELTEKRIALVIGNAAYRTGALATSANDAGLIAQTLQAAGFDVVGARDLDQESLRRALREFLEKASGSGPGTVAFIYLSGYGLQLEGENYFVPVDASIRSHADVAAEALRLSDYMRPLGALKLKASILVLDAARKNPFSMAGAPLAGGLALVEPSPGMLIAFNAAPGTFAPERDGPYGAYAQALAGMMREGGVGLRELFERVRLRVNDTTKGALVPWSASRNEAPFVFFERSPDAPASAASASPEQMAAIRARPLRDLAAPDAYATAVERDTLEGYEEFLAAHPDDPMAKRVRAIAAARRESLTWRSTFAADTPEAYWSYLRRYPHGPHSADCRRRLALRAFAAEAPASFAPIDYDVPPPPTEELPYVEAPALVFADPAYDFAPPPALAVYFLPPPPLDFIVLPAPPPPIEFFALPIPAFVPIPAWCHRPAYVAQPPESVIFNNIHRAVMIDHATNVMTIRKPNGRIVSSEPRSAHGAMASGTPLPPSLARRAAASQPPVSPSTSPPGSAIHPQASGSAPAIIRQRPSNVPLGEPLPGAGGHPLPQLPARPAAGIASTAGITAPPMHPSDPAARGNVQALRPQPAIPHNRWTPPGSSVQQPPPQWRTHSAFGSAPILRPQLPPPPAARPTSLPPPAYRPPAPTQTYRPPPPVPPAQARFAPPPAQAYRPALPPPPAYRPPPPPPPAAYRPPAAPAPAAHAAVARAQAVSRPSPPPIVSRPPPPPPRKR